MRPKVFVYNFGITAQKPISATKEAIRKAFSELVSDLGDFGRDDIKNPIFIFLPELHVQSPSTIVVEVRRLQDTALSPEDRSQLGDDIKKKIKSVPTNKKRDVDVTVEGS